MDMTTTRSIFYYRPKPGDLWRYKTPSMERWKKKRVGHISLCRMPRRINGEIKKNLLIPCVTWDKLPKGRDSGISVKSLLTYGELVKRPDPNSAIAEKLRGRHLYLRRYGRN